MQIHQICIHDEIKKSIENIYLAPYQSIIQAVNSVQPSLNDINIFVDIRELPEESIKLLENLGRFTLDYSKPQLLCCVVPNGAWSWLH